MIRLRRVMDVIVKRALTQSMFYERKQRGDDLYAF